MLSERISSWRICSVQTTVPGAQAQCADQFLIHPDVHAQHVLKGPFQMWNFYAYAEHTRKKLKPMYTQGTHQFLTRMLRVYASVSDPYAQCTHQFLIRMLSLRSA
jgi:hypothetical protein